MNDTESLVSLPAAENYFNLLDYVYVSDITALNHDCSYALIAINIRKLFISHKNSLLIVGAINKLISCVYQDFPNLKVFIPVLDFENTEKLIKKKALKQLLNEQLKLIRHNSVILVNIPTETMIEPVISIQSDTPIEAYPWQPDQFFLCYSFEADHQGNKIYHTKLFGGRNFAEYLLLTHKLITTHLTFEDYQYAKDMSTFSEPTVAAFRRSPIFINDAGIAQCFEVMITCTGKTLFEHSMEFILNTDIKNTKNEYAGYKITNSHFKLGSKVHIRDFIYAKRIFQNSFFTSRFAFRVAKDFLEAYEDIESLTIIGYGMYSQLLINRVEKILLKKTYLAATDINYDMVSDADEPRFLKNVPFKKKIVIIVPINTTFSTTIKIENLILDRISKGDHAELLPSINLILVTHGDFNRDKKYVSELNEFLKGNNNSESFKGNPYKTLNWKTIDTKRKIISIRPNQPFQGQRQQKYLISVPSELYLPEECPLCFPVTGKHEPRLKQILLEESLMQTDKTSVTPDLVLDLPENFKINPEAVDHTVFLNPEAVITGHTIFKGNHFGHFIRPEYFFNKYLPEIELWAIAIRRHLHEIKKDILSSGVLLISAGNRNNTYFADFINRAIFDDSGIVIYYDIAIQATENFIKFFGPHIWHSKYIFYIDDIIQGGNTFLQMNDLVRYCSTLKDNDEPDKRIDAVFTLISKNYVYTKNTIIANTGDTFLSDDPANPFKLKYNFFYQLNIDPSIPGTCAICDLKDKYHELATNSTLDSVKHYFFNKALKLRPRDISDSVDSGSDKVSDWHDYNPLVTQFEMLPWKKDSPDYAKSLFAAFKADKLPDKKYLRILVHHQLNSLFSNHPGIRQELQADYNRNLKDREDKTTLLFNHILLQVKASTPFEQLYQTYDYAVSDLMDGIIRDLIVKILTEHPFNNIKCIKEKVFYWTLMQLELMVNAYKTKKYSFERFRQIKFLLRRSATIGSNYAIHIKTLEKIRGIYDDYSTQNRAFEKQRRIKYAELRGFKTKNTGIEAQMHKRYIEQGLRNIQYVETSVREFDFFLVSIIKDITFHNDAKSLKVEKTIDELYVSEPRKEENQFHYFLRLVKYENIPVLKKGMEILHEVFLPSLQNTLRLENAHLTSFPSVRRKLNAKLKLAFHDYRLSHLKKFLRMNDFESWQLSNPQSYSVFIQFVYLYSMLLNEENDPKSADLLKSKTRSILQCFFRIAGSPAQLEGEDDETDFEDVEESGAFLVLKHFESGDELIMPDKLLYADATEPNTGERDHIFNSSIDLRSLSFLMINGISDKEYMHDHFTEHPAGPGKAIPKKPWSLWEIQKKTYTDGTYWTSLRGNVYPIHKNLLKKDYFEPSPQMLNICLKNDFTESIYLPSDTDTITFIRLTDIFLDENGIHNEGKGVIGLYEAAEETETFSSLGSADKMRLALIVLPLIIRFINKHYDSAILNALEGVNQEMNERERYRHGHVSLLNELVELSSDEIKNPETNAAIKIIHNMLLSGSAIKKLIRNYQELKTGNPLISRENLEKSLHLANCTLEDLVTEIKKCYQIILKYKIETSKVIIQPPVISEVYGNLDKNMKVVIPFKLFDVILTEVLVNAKKNTPDPQSQDTTFFLELVFEQAGELMLLEVRNNCQQVAKRQIDILNKPNHKNTHGLGLIARISDGLFGYFPEKKCEANPAYSGNGGYEFSIKVPLGPVIKI